MCNTCAKQYFCTERKQNCTEIVKWSETKGYGVPERKGK